MCVKTIIENKYMKLIWNVDRVLLKSNVLKILFHPFSYAWSSLDDCLLGLNDLNWSLSTSNFNSSRTQYFPLYVICMNIKFNDFCWLMLYAQVKVLIDKFYTISVS